jgi:membrane protease YdiL (CAAX protease family)
MSHPSPTRHVVAFFVLAYALSWAWWLPLAFGDRVVERGDGWPTHIPGLLGPTLAALLVLSVTEGRAGLRAWGRAMIRWPRNRVWQLASLAPLGFFAIGLAIVAITSGMPPATDFIRYSGTGATLGALAVALVVNAFGEEAGWRGYALPRLQARLGPLRASLLLAALWGLWHAPLFAVVASYRGFSVFTIAGFLIGLTAGAIVLTAIYNGTGGSILAAAVWHGSYNLASATAAADGAIAAVATAAVILWAVSLVQRERAGQPALGRVQRS